MSVENVFPEKFDVDEDLEFSLNLGAESPDLDERLQLQLGLQPSSYYPYSDYAFGSPSGSGSGSGSSSSPSPQTPSSSASTELLREFSYFPPMPMKGVRCVPREGYREERIKDEWRRVKDGVEVEVDVDTDVLPMRKRGRSMGRRVGKEGVDRDCAICFEIAVTPVRTGCCRKLFCREHVFWLRSSSLCPSCDTPLSLSLLTSTNLDAEDKTPLFIPSVPSVPYPLIIKSPSLSTTTHATSPVILSPSPVRASPRVSEILFANREEFFGKDAMSHFSSSGSELESPLSDVSPTSTTTTSSFSSVFSSSPASPVSPSTSIDSETNTTTFDAACDSEVTEPLIEIHRSRTPSPPPAFLLAPTPASTPAWGVTPVPSPPPFAAGSISVYGPSRLSSTGSGADSTREGVSAGAGSMVWTHANPRFGGGEGELEGRVLVSKVLSVVGLLCVFYVLLG